MPSAFRTGFGTDESIAQVVDLPEETFQYDPLDPEGLHELPLRLLKLYPAGLNGPSSSSQNSAKPSENSVECSLEHTSLDAEPTYEALSYCWKPVFPRRYITCNGQTLCVGFNLFQALKELRPTVEDGARYLWIDAISINQGDVEERSRQVRNMRLIYRKARRTIAWLGPEADDSHQAFQYAAEADTGVFDEILLREPSLLDANYVPVTGSDDEQEIFISNYYFKYRDRHDTGHNALLKVFQRHYFCRIWIVQEIIVSRNVQFRCGSQSLPFETFYDSFFWNIYDPWDPDGQVFRKPKGSFRPQLYEGNYGFVKDLLIASEIYRSTGGIPFSSALQRFRRFSATDPRDKVFAVIGISDMARLPLADQLPVDYKMKVQDVYRSATLYSMEHERSLDVIGLPPASREFFMGGLPSWVPNFKGHGRFGQLGKRYRHLTSDLPAFRSTLKSDAEFDYSEDTESITLSGIMVDKIGDRGCEFENALATDVVHRIRIWVSWAQDLLRKVKPYSEEEMSHIIKRTLLPGSNGPDSKKDEWKNAPPFFEKDHWTDLKYLNYRMVRLDDESRAKASSLWASVVGANRGRRLTLCEGGYLALAPENIEEGDNVALVKGDRFPLILRRHADTNNWILIGEAYIYDMMQGERYLEDECGPITLI